MSTSGDVELTILDGGGAVSVPSSEVQVILGTCSSGTAAQVVATRNPNTITSVLGQGPLVEYAAMCIAAGGTALCLKVATNTVGKVRGSDATAVNITSSTNATPIAVTATAHGLEDGDVATITGHLINTTANGTFIVDKTSATVFTLKGTTGAGVGAASGTIQKTGVRVLDSSGLVTGVGTSIPTVTGEPYDYYFVKVWVTTAGTIGTAGIKLRISLDAGRTYGPTIALGTATTLVITDTGITLNFAAGTLTKDSKITFSTTAPAWATSGIQACFNALQASAYAVSGWGSMFLTGDLSGADATTVQGFLNTYETGKLYTRLLGNARDANVPGLWGGAVDAGESEATWMDALMSDFSATTAKRMCISGGHYNMSSRIPKALAGLPRFRRPLSWALGARQVTLQPQRHAGRVKDGPLADIATDPVNDPTDGFIYHDERLNPGLDEAKFAAAKTRVKKRGWWIDNPNLMSSTGSVFTILPFGSVMDIACNIVTEVGAEDINEDVRLNDNGTLYDNDAIAIEKRMGQALKDNMLAKNMISNYTVVVDRSNNVQATSEVNVTVTIYARGYILQENITIGYGTAAAAA